MAGRPCRTPTPPRNRSSGARRSYKLGELGVSKGSIDWLPGNGRTRYRMRWEKFDELMKADGRGTPR